MLALIPLVLVLASAAPDTAVIPMKEIVVSATKTAKDVADVPNAASVIGGAELRRSGARTLADALQDLVGVDTGDGSDNGLRLPNVGLWGLKEFDALLFTLDGVPVGGPFNPSLSQIPVEDLDRVEVVKGPQGTLYGVSAFAGMIQAFSRTDETGLGHVTIGGGSFSDLHGGAGIERRLADGTSLRLSASGLHTDGWQDRTGDRMGRGSLALSHTYGSARIGLDLVGYQDRQDWGTPTPYDGGKPLAGFRFDRNYAVGGAEIEHRVFGATSQAAYAFNPSLRLENTIAVTRDRQHYLRSFVGEVAGDSVTSEVVDLRPVETSVFEDLHTVAKFAGAGRHELVGGVAVTWGRTRADGTGRDLLQFLSTYAPNPTVDQIPLGDNRSASDRRTFVGIYLHDEWAPAARLTIGGGGRYDNVSEKLATFGQEVGGDPEEARDSRTDGAWSGDASALFRAAPAGGWLQVANVYVTYRSSFKPAAPNLTEAEGAEILAPERTHSIEGGLKSRAFDDQVALNLSVFQMDFRNMVVATQGAAGPELTNAGRERFKGEEVEVRLAPRALRSASLAAGFAHHDARFVQFTFFADPTTFRDVSGKKLELVPANVANLKLEYAPAKGPGGFVAARWQDRRPLNRRNTFFTDAYAEWDAGATLDWGPALLTITGRNLGDDRHVVSESDIGDSQFYVSPPRRVTAAITTSF
jgi:outer membrane receptor protein involved in Fe transport